MSHRPVRLREMSEIRTRYYFRVSLPDRPGMLARIAAVLGGHDISIASVLQQEKQEGDHVPVVILTHGAQEREVDAALAEIDTLDIVGDRTVRLRIEES